MRLFYSTDHEGHWPVGVASIVIADSEDEARKLLTYELESAGLRSQSNRKDGFTLKEVDLFTPSAHILNDGNY